MAEPDKEIRREILLDRDVFVVVFDYDPEIVAEVKNIPGRKYSTAPKSWLIPPWPEAVSALLAMGAKNGFRASHACIAEINRLASLVPDTTAIGNAGLTRFAFRGPSGDLLFHFEWESLIATTVKDVTGAFWDARALSYRLPIARELSREVLYFIETYDFIVEPAEHERLLSETEEEFDEGFNEPQPRFHVDEVVAFHLLMRMPHHRRESLMAAVENRSLQHLALYHEDSNDVA